MGESDRKTEDVARGQAAENLYSSLYGHGFVSIETSRESFRQRCRLHAKWKEYLARGGVCGSVSRWPLFGQYDINGLQ